MCLCLYVCTLCVCVHGEGGEGAIMFIVNIANA